MIIKVLGPGCAKCDEAEQLVRKLIEKTGSDAVCEKVSDLKEMMALGVMSTPAVVIDGNIKCTGRVPSAYEITSWLAGKDIPADTAAAVSRQCTCK